jgi:hypothetical protein
MLEMLGCAELHNVHTTGGSMAKFDFRSNLKVSKSVLKTRNFQNDLTTEILYHLLEHMAVYAGSIALPELALPVILTLKRHIKTTPVVRSFCSITNIIVPPCKLTLVLFPPPPPNKKTNKQKLAFVTNIFFSSGVRAIQIPQTNANSA